MYNSQVPLSHPSQLAKSHDGNMRTHKQSVDNAIWEYPSSAISHNRLVYGQNDQINI